MKSTFEIPYTLLHLLCKCILHLGFALKIHGREQLENIQGPIILAGNHAGLLDSLILMAAFPRHFRFLMDEKVFGWSVIGRLVRYGNILPINPQRAKASMTCAVRALRDGESICIFPEGKLSLNGQLGGFQEGVAFLQEKSEATILPFALTGSFEAWPYGQRFPRFYPVCLAFGEPIQFGAIEDRTETTSLLRNQVSEMLLQLEQRSEPCQTNKQYPASY